MKKIITSIIGTGKRATGWADFLGENDNFVLKSVSSRNKERGTNFAKHHNCEFVHDTKEILQDNKVDLIIISSSPHRNVLAVDFAKNKKNMILEKPLSLNLNELELIFSECKKNKIICAAGLDRYYDTFFPVIEKYIKVIGKCFHSEYKKYYKGENIKEKFLLKKLTDKTLTNWPIHQFSQTNKLFGQPLSLIASEFYSTDENVIIDANILIKYENNNSCNFSIKHDCKYDFGEYMTLYCENGVIEINFNTQTVSGIRNPLNNKYSRAILSRFKYDLLHRKKLMKFDKKKIIFSETFWPGGPRTILKNFAKIFYEEKNIDLVDINHNYLTTKMAFACKESIKQKSWVKI